MYINRALLLVMGVVLIFWPTLWDWGNDAGADWFRPYQLWLLVIVAAYWNERSRYPDEL